MILELLSFACPFILASSGALFSQYAGMLALFLDGLITFSGFLTFSFTVLTDNGTMGTTLAVFVCILIILLFVLIIEKTKADIFIAGLGLNLIFHSGVSLLSSIFFKTRGVLTHEHFVFVTRNIQITEIIITMILCAAAVGFLLFTKHGIYFRVTGTDSDVLTVKGINPSLYRILSWCICAFFASICGSFLAFKISSFVPNLSGGKGWICLAAVLLADKKPLRIITAVIVFCAADYLGVHIQNIFPSVPTSILLSLPYITALLMITVSPSQKN
ncbi:MAG: ABC transporter permease [Treponema sp.]|nr:ABC transporter permease [Treponema sp.]